MAKNQSAFSTVPKGANLQFAPATGATNLQQVTSNGVATPHADAANDPKGYKNWIAHDVAHGIYPSGTGVDPNQTIADDLAKNADIRALQANFFASLDAKKLGYSWANVTTTDLSSLKIVADLMALVVAHLT
jgi:hypothetical protein